MSGTYNSRFNSGSHEAGARTQFNFTTSSTGNKVFEWTVRIPGLAKEIPVEIKSFNDGTEIWFEASSSSIKEKIRDTDIARLRTSVETYIEERAFLFTGIDWKDWLEVVVSGDNSDFTDSPYSSLGADLKIEVRRLKRGVVPGSDRIVTIMNGAVTAWPEAKSISQTGDTEGGIRLDEAKERSYVPETAENLAAINNIVGKMAELRMAVAGLLSQDGIERNLAAGLALALPSK